MQNNARHVSIPHTSHHALLWDSMLEIEK